MTGERLRDRLKILDDEVGRPLTAELVERVYKAADIIEALEATVYALLDLAEDAITLLEKYDPAATARLKRSLNRQRKAHRARELRTDGLSAAQVGIRMADEDGRSKPYAARQVRRWTEDRAQT